MLRVGVFICLLLGLVDQASANGRSPATSTLNFRRGMETHMVHGTTFGVITSKDGGLTWNWVCEDAIGYSGMYDPDYAFNTSGSLFATTFNGLRVNTDGCVYRRTVLTATGGPCIDDDDTDTIADDCPTTDLVCAADQICEQIHFFSTVAIAPSDGTVYAASVDVADGKIYKSTDDGVSFPVSTLPPGWMPSDWWQTLEVAPSNSAIVYLTGYRSLSAQARDHFIFKSTDGGLSYVGLPVDDISATGNSTIELVGIGKTDPDLVYVRVKLWEDLIGDAIYRSTDGGQNWVQILALEASISFVLRGNGQIVAGTQVFGAQVSANQGTTWTPLVNPPKINCLAENTAGEVWACTQNYGTPQLPGDEFGIMKTTDLATWTGVLKYQDIKEPEPCPAGTAQRDTCDVQLWCGLCAQLGCNANRDCGFDADGEGTDGTVVNPKDPGGCCQTGSEGAAGLLAISGAVGMVLLRRRRRR